MNKNRLKFGFVFSLSCVYGLFLIASSMMTKIAKGYFSYTEFFFSFVLACILMFFASKAAFYVFSGRYCEDFSGVLQKILFFIFAILGICASVYAGMICLADLVEFTENTILQGRKSIEICILILILCAYMAKLNGEVIRKFSVLCYTFVIFMTVFLFFSSLPNFNYSFLRESFSAKFSFERMAYALADIFIPCILCAVYFSLRDNGSFAKYSNHSSYSGLFLGFSQLTICHFNTLLILGQQYAQKQKYPYFTSMGVSSFGKLFSRLEGFGYAMFFVACTLKITLCISVACLLCERLVSRKYGKLAGKILNKAVPLVLFAAIMLTEIL